MVKICFLAAHKSCDIGRSRATTGIGPMDRNETIVSNVSWFRFLNIFTMPIRFFYNLLPNENLKILLLNVYYASFSKSIEYYCCLNVL